MPVDGSGNFTRSYNFVADRNAGTKIMAARVDGEFDNVAAAINLMFLRNGAAPMTGSLNMNTNSIYGLGDGLAGTPALRLNSDATTGLFSPGVGRIGISAGGTMRLDVGATAIAASVPVTLSSTLAVTGATTLSSTLNVTGATTLAALTVASIAAVNFTAAPGVFSVAGTERARFDSSGNFGIGTNTPAQRLDVNGDIQLSSSTPAIHLTVSGPTISVPSANTLVFGTSGAERTRIDNNGNFGIGTTNPGQRLDVNGDIQLSSSTPAIRLTVGGPTISVPSANTLVFGTSGLERTRIDNNGNFGIGTASPGQRLDVNGDVLLSSGTPTIRITVGGPTISVPTANNLTFGTSGLERARIDNNGNFGIGTTNPGQRLDVNGNIILSASTPTIMLNSGGPTISVPTAGTLAMSTAGTERIRISSTGDFGIGVTNPGYRLDLLAADATAGIGYAMRFRANATADGAAIQFTDTGATAQRAVVISNNSDFIFQTEGARTIRFRTNGANDRLTIDQNGDIASPARTLAVGFKGIPWNTQAGNYTLALADMAGGVFATSTASTITVPPEGTANFPSGAVVTIVNDGSAAKTIARGAGVAMIWAGVGTDSNRTLAAGGMCTVVKTPTSNRWYISGTGLS